MIQLRNFFFLILMATCFFLYAGETSESEVYVDSLIREAKKSPISAAAFHRAENILQISEKLNYPEGVAFALADIAEYYNKKGIYTKALDFYQKLYKYGQSKQNKNFQAIAYDGLGGVYYEIELFIEAEEYFNKARDLSLETNDLLLLSDVLNNLALVYSARGESEKAIDYFTKSKKAAKEYGDVVNTVIDNNIGLEWIALGEPDKAIDFFWSYIDYVKDDKDSLELAYAYSTLGYGYHHLKLFEKAFSYYDTALYYAKTFDQDDVRYEIYLNMSQAYEFSNDYQKALEYFDKYQALRDSVLSFRKQLHINELEVKFETERKEKELSIKEGENKELMLHRQRLWIVILCLFILASFITMQYLRMRNNAIKEKKLNKIQEELSKNQLKLKDVQAKELENQLSNRRKDLTNLVLDITRKNDFSKKLIENLEGLQKKKPLEIQSKLQELIRAASDHLRISEDLERFQTNIEELNQDFYDALDRRFENLTLNEKQLCGFIRLNLSNKEIATIRGISISSAKMNRHRLRKKLRIDPETDLVSFLQNL